MEFMSYKQLQAVAKKNGVKANLSKSALLRALMAPEDCHDGAQQGGTQGSTKDSSNPSHADCADKSRIGEDSTRNGIQESTEDSNSNRAQEGTRSTLETAAVPASATARAEEDPAVPSEPAVLTERSGRRKSERLSPAKEAAKEEQRVAGGSSRVTIKEPTAGKIQQPAAGKVKQPNTGPSDRFARAHQHLFAGQASIEAYGKTPTKKIASFKENMLLSRATPVRPVEFGPGVKSAKRGLTVASKPCSLVVARSSKKPTQVKEFRLSSNQTGKREGFKFRPYSGPVRPLTPAKKTVGASAASFFQGSRRNTSLAPKSIKSTLASGNAQVARKNAFVQSRKVQRNRILTETRAGRP